MHGFSLFTNTEIYDSQKFENPKPEFKLYVNNLNVIIKILILKRTTIMEKMSYGIFILYVASYGE